MSRINGIGTWLLGVEKTDHKGVFTATSWFTFLFLPVFPLARYVVKPLKVGGNKMSYQKLGKTKFEWGEVFRTYLCGLILMPLALLAPLPFAIVEVQTALGIPTALQPLMIGLAILWLIVFVWKLKDWDENRWLQN